MGPKDEKVVSPVAALKEHDKARQSPQPGQDQDKDDTVKCLSSEPHFVKDIRDFQCHVFGCLPIKCRSKYFESEEVWYDAADLKHADGVGTEGIKRVESTEATRLLELLFSTALSLEGEFKRIDILRNTGELQALVNNVNSSREEWRACDDYKTNINTIAPWRQAMDCKCRNDAQEEAEECSAWLGQGNSRPYEYSDALTTEQAVSSHKIPVLPPILAHSRTSQPSSSYPAPVKGTSSSDNVAAGTNTEAPSNQAELASRVQDDFRKKLCGMIHDLREEENHDTRLEDKEYNLERDTKAQYIRLERSCGREEHQEGLVGVLRGANESVQKDIFKGMFPDQQLSVENLLRDNFIRASHRKSAVVESEAQGTQYKSSEESGDGKQPGIEPSAPQPEAAAQEIAACPETVQWFHMPSNNMSWVEKAIDRYFRDSDRDTQLALQRARLVLRAECWRGQEHGSGNDNIVHSRHLRSLCERFSTDPDLSYAVDHQANMVVFMPFLHWETDRRRSMMARVIEQQIHNQNKRGAAKAITGRLNRQTKRKATNGLSLAPPSLPKVKHKDAYYCDPVSDGAVTGTIEDILWDKIRETKIIRPEKPVTDTPKSIQSQQEQPPITQVQAQAPLELGRIVKMKPSKIFFGVPMDKNRRLTPQHPLAQYLLDAARLFEAMETFQDRRLLETYLFDASPLHPRRTLDQAYFWKLKSTQRRDKDQVVFRSTRANMLHKLRPLPDNDFKANAETRQSHTAVDLPAQETEGPRARQERIMEGWGWTDHGQYEDNNGCQQCFDDICRLSRTIMVDQLWMWILDQDTILTCFPHRYGVGKKDPSGLHHTIRTRLIDRANPLNHVRSVFDLGLIILDEAYGVLFDRIKTEDMRPQILDIFSESIGKLTDRQTLAFRHLWQLTRELTFYYESPIDNEIPDRLVTPLLNMTPEGLLQQEIRDIVDELRILMHIAKQQEEVITKFIAGAQDILGTEESGLRIFNTSNVQHITINGDNTRITIKQQPDESETKDKSADKSADQQAIENIRKQQRKSFDKRSKILSAKVTELIAELDGLKTSAESTAQSVDDLISLKQQQASVVQAYQAMKQGEETVKQGRAIMLFTVMTIVFLPLSFMTSLFGMNAIELTGAAGSGGGSGGSSSDNTTQPTNSTVSTPPLPGPGPGLIPDFWAVTFSRQLAIMFPVSFIIIALALILAFAPTTRSYIFSLLRLWLVRAGVSLGLYKRWLSRHPPYSETTARRRKRQGRQMEDVVRRGMAERKRVEAYLRDAATAKEGRATSIEGDKKEANQDKAVASGGAVSGEAGRTRARWFRRAGRRGTDEENDAQ